MTAAIGGPPGQLVQCGDLAGEQVVGVEVDPAQLSMTGGEPIVTGLEPT
jgi:hypothetical protein